MRIFLKKEAGLEEDCHDVDEKEEGSWRHTRWRVSYETVFPSQLCLPSKDDELEEECYQELWDYSSARDPSSCQWSLIKG